MLRSKPFVMYRRTLETSPFLHISNISRISSLTSLSPKEATSDGKAFRLHAILNKAAVNILNENTKNIESLGDPWGIPRTFVKNGISTDQLFAIFFLLISLFFLSIILSIYPSFFLSFFLSIYQSFFSLIFLFPFFSLFFFLPFLPKRSFGFPSL